MYIRTQRCPVRFLHIRKILTHFYSLSLWERVGVRAFHITCKTPSVLFNMLMQLTQVYTIYSLRNEIFRMNRTTIIPC